MIAVGIGCRKACPVEDIVALVDEAVALLPDGISLDGLFSIVEKRGEPGLEGAAQHLGLPLFFLDRSALASADDDAHSASRRVEEMFGLHSVAETAALAGAGQGSVLLVPRIASARATCAIAGSSTSSPVKARSGSEESRNTSPRRERALR